MAGRGKRESDEAILRVFVSGADPVYSAKQVAEHLDIKKDATDKRLRELAESGFVDSKKIGPSRAWWITQRGERFLADERGGDDSATDDE